MKCCTLLHFRYVCDSRKLKKVRAKKIRVARKNSHKDTVNLDNACASDMQNISVSDEPVDVAIQRRVAQASHKHKKKYSDNKGSSNETSETQCKKCRENLLFSFTTTNSFSYIIKISFINILNLAIT